MNRSFYTGAVGASQQQSRMNVLGNNISNVNTHGFKSERPAFSALMYGTILGIDEAQLPIGTGTRMVGADTNFGAGPLAQTGRKLDYALMGSGFFAVYDAGNDEISYTRDGSFTLSVHQQTAEDGTVSEIQYLTDGDGRFVLNQRGGLMEVTDAEQKQPVGVFEFINQNGMLPLGGSRFLPVEKNGQVRMGTSEVEQGYLEASNVDLAQELTKVIEAQRSYSYALKMVQTSDEVENTINGLRG